MKGYPRQRRDKKYIVTTALLALALVLVLGFYFIQTNELRDEVAVLEEDLTDYKSSLEDVEDDYRDAMDTVEELESREEELHEKLNRTEVFYEPTEEELISKVAETGIHEREYADHYDCVDFSFDLLDELRQEGIFSCPTLLYFEEQKVGHMILQADTEEGGVFIEPQSNIVLDEISKGQDYCDLVDWDDCIWTITEIHTCSL